VVRDEKSEREPAQVRKLPETGPNSVAEAAIMQVKLAKVDSRGRPEVE
jgi:hypothetical protein